MRENMGIIPSQNIHTLVLVVDMQDGQWKSFPPKGEEGQQSEFGDLADRVRLHKAEKRRTAMEALVPDVQKFIDRMRAEGADVAFVLMENDDVTDFGGISDGLRAEPEDKVLMKSNQSVLPENAAYFEQKLREAHSQGKALQIKVCGVWGGECIANSVVDLHKAGYDVKVIGDLILDSSKPSQDSDRPNEYEANALHQMNKAVYPEAYEQSRYDRHAPTVSQWSEDAVKERRAVNAAYSKSYEPSMALTL